MKFKNVLLALLLIAFIILPGSLISDEGMWLLDGINKLPLSEMKKNGLELTPEQIYNSDGQSIKDAIVLLGGGTASFVSASGLILTNHHVAYGAIVSVSSVMEDRLKHGFLAQNYEEELPIENMTAQVLVSMKEITSEVLAAVNHDKIGVNDSMTSQDRQKTINAKLREIEKREKGDTEYECRATDVFNGVKYYVFTFEIMKDVRLVYAPPNSIGNYGGEIDNWMWPRHTGDFSFMRTYVSPEGKSVKFAKENVPYKPKHFLPISTKGFEEGSYMMIMGFPGRTFRYRTSYDIDIAYNEALPMTIDLFKTRIDIIQNLTKNERAKELKYANRLRGIENSYKNSLGVVEGMRKINLLQKKRSEEEEFLMYVNSKPDLQIKYGTVLLEMKRLIDELSAYNKKRIVLSNIQSSCDMLRLAQRFMTYAKNPPKDSTGKPIERTEADYSAVKPLITSAFKNVDLAIDKELLTAMLIKAANLPANQQIEAVVKIVGNKTGEKRDKAIRCFVDDLYSDSDLLSQEKAEKFLTKSDKKILDDEFVEFATALDKDDAVVKEKYARYEAEMALMRTQLMEAWIAWKGESLYPDANRTIRFTYGTVKPFKPRDAVYYDYVTTLGGVVEKETGADPFEVPVKLKELWEKKDFSIYADKRLGDIPVAFLANLDITGGNSGSPVINGRGELAGCAFDGNWESVVGDYYFQEPLNRTISVDSRYILFILDKYSDSQNILYEMVIR
ncbi:MAG: S46 family peptidase [Bacteroidetes bacterium]|nr:S46 family peptidase [Bacteroidota bacterium]